MQVSSSGEFKPAYLLVAVLALGICLLAGLSALDPASPTATPQSPESAMRQRLTAIASIEHIGLLEIVGGNAVYAEIRTAPSANRQPHADEIARRIRATYPATVWLSLILDDGLTAYDYTQAAPGAAWQITALRR